ncbi:hypothetical protein BC828DRAFT_435749 [Blastocladiella britannica]|nr:hypothetical protein BC828DRAFT_435749 [Blastocladiella britannica]
MSDPTSAPEPLVSPPSLAHIVQGDSSGVLPSSPRLGRATIPAPVHAAPESFGPARTATAAVGGPGSLGMARTPTAQSAPPGISASSSHGWIKSLSSSSGAPSLSGSSSGVASSGASIMSMQSGSGASAPDPLDGVVVSSRPEDYELEATVGFGSSATVYAAVYRPSRRRVAVKVMELDMFQRNQIEELRRETTVMSLCKHPNVLRVYASFVAESKLFIVTPFLSAGSVLDIMKSAYPRGIDETSTATILKQALQGLAYLHANSHIHRDIKAGNILLSETGVAMLADFGVSASMEAAESRGMRTRRTFVGTPCWMAPEVMEQAGYSFSADIWSFGITAIELAMGAAPLAKYPPIKVLMLTLSNDPPTLDRDATKYKYSKAAREFVDACLQKDPSRRPSAERLLGHAFIKAAKKPAWLVPNLIAELPPLVDRARARGMAPPPPEIADMVRANGGDASPSGGGQGGLNGGGGAGGKGGATAHVRVPVSWDFGSSPPSSPVDAVAPPSQQPPTVLSSTSPLPLPPLPPNQAPQPQAAPSSGFVTPDASPTPQPRVVTFSVVSGAVGLGIDASSSNGATPDPGVSAAPTPPPIATSAAPSSGQSALARSVSIGGGGTALQEMRRGRFSVSDMGAGPGGGGATGPASPKPLNAPLVASPLASSMGAGVPSAAAGASGYDGQAAAGAAMRSSTDPLPPLPQRRGRFEVSMGASGGGASSSSAAASTTSSPMCGNGGGGSALASPLLGGGGSGAGSAGYRSANASNSAINMAGLGSAVGVYSTSVASPATTAAATAAALEWGGGTTPPPPLSSTAAAPGGGPSVPTPTSSVFSLQTVNSPVMSAPGPLTSLSRQASVTATLRRGEVTPGGPVATTVTGPSLSGSLASLSGPMLAAAAAAAAASSSSPSAAAAAAATAASGGQQGGAGSMAALGAVVAANGPSAMSSHEVDLLLRRHEMTFQLLSNVADRVGVRGGPVAGRPVTAPAVTLVSPALPALAASSPAAAVAAVPGISMSGGTDVAVSSSASLPNVAAAAASSSALGLVATLSAAAVQVDALVKENAQLRAENDRLRRDLELALRRRRSSSSSSSSSSSASVAAAAAAAVAASSTNKESGPHAPPPSASSSTK